VRRASAGADDEFVLEPARRAPEGHVDAWPEIPVEELPEAPQPGTPLRRVVSEQVAHPLRARLPSLDGRRLAADEPERERLLLFAAGEREDRLGPREEEAHPRPLGGVADARVRLACVGNEADWQLLVVGQHLPL